MSGTINLALSQQFDMDGAPLSGGLLYFFQAGTSTPQNAFQDTALTIVHPNPLVLDASGRVPMFYVASTEPPNVGQTPNGQIKIRLTDKNGVVVIAADNLLVIGPAGGGGGGGTVDATTVLATGDIKARYGIGTLTGFVRCNGNTIGNGVSGATERANADCQALFEYLWSTGVLGVFSGSTPNRGANATSDFTANKNILLPDLRGRTLFGLDDMGATAANRLTSSFFGSSATVLGAAGGSEKHTLTTTELAQHSHGITDAGHIHGYSDPGHSHGVTDTHTHSYLDGGFGPGASAQSGPGVAQQDNFRTTGGTNSGAITVNSGGIGIAISNAGTGISINNSPTSATVAHAIASPGMVMTFYIKL